jgi:hypothetical protein
MVEEGDSAEKPALASARLEPKLNQTDVGSGEVGTINNIHASKAPGTPTNSVKRYGRKRTTTVRTGTTRIGSTIVMKVVSVAAYVGNLPHAHRM